MKSSLAPLAAVLALTIAGCPGGTTPDDDAGGTDAGGMDAGATVDGGGTDGATDDDGGSTVDDGGTTDDVGTDVDGGSTTSDGGTASDVGRLPDAGGACDRNADCGPGDYCATAETMCGGAGMCTAIPRGCPDVVAPVCGCDGLPYGNACEAAAAGENVASIGECDGGICEMRPRPACCFDNADCAGGGARRCVNETGCSDGLEGTCVAGRLSTGQCWENSDCPDDSAGRPLVCSGARICPCAAFCLLPDAPGTCAVPE